jgi:hypothetical protein
MSYFSARLVGAMLCIVATLGLIVGCENFPTETQLKCNNPGVYLDPVEVEPGVWVPYIMVPIDSWAQACEVPGEEFGGALTTMPDPKGGRKYVFTLTVGPAVDNVYVFKDVYDAVSVLDQVLYDNGYDTSYTQTGNGRDALKSWLIGNWISADAFHLQWGC